MVFEWDVRIIQRSLKTIHLWVMMALQMYMVVTELLLAHLLGGKWKRSIDNKQMDVAERRHQNKKKFEELYTKLHEEWDSAVTGCWIWWLIRDAKKWVGDQKVLLCRTWLRYKPVMSASGGNTFTVLRNLMN